MNIPLINTNDKESINTSLIAIKRATEELNNLIKIADEKMAQLDEKAKKYTDDKINALDVASVGGSGKYISAISETDGKISAIASDLATTIISGNNRPVTSDGVARALNNKVTTDIYTNTDLNDITTFGVYRVNYTTATTDPAQLHYPTGNFGVVIVVNANGNIGQLFIPDSNEIIYKRYLTYGTSNWSNWTSFTNSADIASSIKSAVNEIVPIGVITLLNEEKTYDFNAGSVALLGAYGTQLFEALVTPPNGYHVEYVLSMLGSTSGNCYVRARLNNIATDWLQTWSGYPTTFRVTRHSVRFRASDIVLEPTFNFTWQEGCNLYFEIMGTETNGSIYNITVSAFLVKD